MFLDTRFELEDRRFKNRKTAISAATTITLHSMIFLFLIGRLLTPPDPPYTDSAGGVSVNFGTDETGVGDVQQTTLTPIQADFVPPPTETKKVEPTPQENIETQDLEEAPVVESKKTPDTPKPAKVESTETPKTAETAKLETTPTNSTKPSIAMPEHKVDPNAMFKKGAYGNPNKSSGDGAGGNQGDQGKAYGDPNSRNYMTGEDGIGMGPGRGDLRGVNLKGRRSIALPGPRHCNEKGNVIIDITVDRDGDVVEAKYHREGSTLTDNCSIEAAKRAAKISKFNSAPNAEPLQYGSINYVFAVQ